MDFTLSPEQLLIKDSVARFAQGAHAGGDHWKTFGELGWLAIGAPEDLGGFGGPIETLLLMEQFGRGLVVAPYVSQVVFAGAILRSADRLDLVEQLAEGTHRFTVAYEEPGARYDPSVVSATASADGNVSGKKVRVLDPSTANTFIVSARSGDEIALYLVPAGAAGVTIATYAAEDGHDVGDVTFADAPGERIAGDGLALLQTGLERATAALCAEGLGLMSLMLDATVDYTKQRQQFGVPIGSFQALQHKMAEMYMELELARSMAYFAAMTLETETDAQKRAHWIAGAKAQVARSGRFVGQNAIQLHGGIGMSEEYKVGHYFKRMTIVERLLGDTTYQIARFNATAGVGEREPVTA